MDLLKAKPRYRASQSRKLPADASETLQLQSYEGPDHPGPPCICAQNTGGKGRPPRSSVIHRVSVKVSSDQRPPCLPEPEALTPPKGTCGSSLTDEQFT